ncbi:MAG: SGNH/GDSL hydrolase family protein [Planctomycetota bacterium]
MPFDPQADPHQLPRFLALGDSYTIGESVEEPDRWPNQLARRLGSVNRPVSQPRILAKTGWTTGELLQEILAAELNADFDIVSLLIGVNNQYRGLQIEEFSFELNRLLDEAIRFAQGNSNRVIVLSIPDWSVTPFAADRDRETIATEIDRFNKVKRATVEEHRCHFVDITPISRRASKESSLLTDDQLHPSATMYAAWCDQALPVAKQILQS